MLQLHLSIDTRPAFGFLDAQALLALTRQLLIFDALLAVFLLAARLLGLFLRPSLGLLFRPPVSLRLCRGLCLLLADPLLFLPAKFLERRQHRILLCLSHVAPCDVRCSLGKAGLSI
jgi:hypothetical protein